MTPIDLGLGSDGEDHPRRLVLLPNPNSNGKQEHHLLAYGGDDGTISLVVTGQGTHEKEVSIARQFDEPVRAVAVSKDGTRVAVGFEDGSTQIFVYDLGLDDETKNQHPFILAAASASKNDDDDDQGFLSQSDGLGDTVSTDEVSFSGPKFDTPVRDLQFDPRSDGSSKNRKKYYLAVACESCFCIIDANSSKTFQETGYLLQDACEKEHNNCGIRGISYATTTSTNDDGDNNKTYLVSLAMDGRMCTWDVSCTIEDPLLDEWELQHRDAGKCITKVDVGEINGADVFDRSCLPVSFCQDDGDISRLALPGSTDVQLRDWMNPTKHEFIPSIDDRGHTDTIVSMAFSPMGDYLVTSGRDGRVVLWQLFEDEEVGRFVCRLGQYESTPTHMLWTTTGTKEVLHMACANGTLVNLVGRNAIVPKSSHQSKKQTWVSSSQEEEEEQPTIETQPPPIPESQTETQPLPSRNRLSKRGGNSSKNDDSDDDIDFGEDNGGATKSATKKTSFVDDQAEEADDNDEDDATVDFSSLVHKHSASSSSKDTADGGDDAAFDDVNNNDDNDDMINNNNDDDADFEFDTNHDDIPVVGHSSIRTLQQQLPDPQPAFAPSSTPLDLPRRIMCWNHIGTVSLLRSDDGRTRNAVDIDFTDAALRRPVSFTDNMNFILGSLGEDGAVFATDLKEDDNDENDDELGNIVDDLNMSEKTKAAVRRSQRRRAGDKGSGQSGSSIYFHRFETFGALRDKDWYLTLPDGERAMGCACGEGWAAVMTSRRFLRFFTAGGNQGPVLWLKGEPITMVGRSQFLAVFYHESSPLLDGTQKIGFTLYDATTAREITSGSTSCISAGSSLSWAGFSNDCSLMAMDNDGMLSMLVGVPCDDGTDKFSWEWSPMLDTVGHRKSKDDNFWPVTIQDGKFVCVPLKGGNEHPDAARRPVTTTLSLRMPLARTTIEKGHALEELSVRANLALNQKKFMNGIIAVDDADEEELQEEYDALSAQVDKVTLKLFMTTVEAGKVERSLDLVDRLHLEKSFDIAIRVADQMNHRNLSDRIEDIKDRKFAEPQEEEEAEEDYDESANSSHYGNHFTGESPQAHLDDGTEDSRRISPDVGSRLGKRTLEDTYDEHDEDDEDPSPKPVKQRTRFDLQPKKKFNPTQMNPFAKKKLESPGKRSVTPKSPAKSPNRSSLSRTSTFSKQSREQSKVARRIM